MFVGVSSLCHSIVDCALFTCDACYFSRLVLQRTYVCQPLSTVAGRARGSSRRHLAQVPSNREQLAMIGSAATAAAAARAHVRESALASSRGSCWSRSCWSWSCCCCSLCSIRLAGIKFQCVDASLSSGWGDFLCSVLRCART